MTSGLRVSNAAAGAGLGLQGRYPRDRQTSDAYLQCGHLHEDGFFNEAKLQHELEGWLRIAYHWVGVYGGNDSPAIAR